MSYTPYNAPLLEPVLGDRQAAACFSIKADIDAMLKFETVLAHAQARIGMISEAAAKSIENAITAFAPDMPVLQAAIAKDGMVVPGLIKQLRAQLSADHAASLHLHCTSQDVIDTSAMMRMRECSNLIAERLTALTKKLGALQRNHMNNSFMTYTRMQAALPSIAGDRIGLWLDVLPTLGAELASLKFPIQLSGPIGSSSAYDGKAKKLAEIIAKNLGLDVNEYRWQANRGPVLSIAECLAHITGHLGKIGADISLMAQMGEAQIQLSGGGGSSAMAHKKNPVLAETLITQARFNATQISGIHHAVLHEQERSGSSWMLEWMIMPQMFVVAASSVDNALQLIDSIERVGKPAR